MGRCAVRGRRFSRATLPWSRRAALHPRRREPFLARGRLDAQALELTPGSAAWSGLFPAGAQRLIPGSIRRVEIQGGGVGRRGFAGLAESGVNVADHGREPRLSLAMLAQAR